jgi:Zn-dependent protease
MFFTLRELIDIMIMSAAVGYIFSDLLSRFRPVKDPLIEFSRGTFNLENFKFAVIATAPAVLFHELSHKFLALAFGMQATFHAAYFWLGIGVVMKLISFPFIFFVPAFVSITGTGTYLQSALVAFAGPATNGLLWLISYILMKKKLVGRKYYPVVFLTGRVNMFLFIFNMIPIPGFDGFAFYSDIFHAFIG